MSQFHILFVLSFLLLLPLATDAHALDFCVINNASSTKGAHRFMRELGIGYTKRELIASTSFIWSLFHEHSASDIKHVKKVTLYIDVFDGLAYTINDEIHINADYIATYSGDVKREITGVIVHELAHVWQWFADGQAPGGLIEGIADFVRLKRGYAPSHWVHRGQGDKWDQGYDVTARFLDYCNDLKHGFVAKLNKKMKHSYSDRYFLDLLGKSVDQLWSDYKDIYGK
ncbi:hypothetical protein K2173_024000 [Erythroxylum novogranatense]|uniref:Plant basic secretory protein (BSP) family protein n=1 Tax=Erythroxylum novogranatense TaxID=1862640 RepID=A0AAV8TSU4_9ROSI|nr:hypothetical protein K2173_024000 [Erythroxylum novogranatense]